MPGSSPSFANINSFHHHSNSCIIHLILHMRELGVLVISCCIPNCPQTEQLKTTNIHYLRYFLWVRNLSVAAQGGSSSRSLMKLWANCWLGQQSHQMAGLGRFSLSLLFILPSFLSFFLSFLPSLLHSFLPSSFPFLFLSKVV